MKAIKKLVCRIRGTITTGELMERGMVVGKNFQRQNEVILDPDHCWLITIGDNVTLAPRVHILAHDASTKQFLGCTKIGRVDIGNNVFIGAESVILPNVHIGDNVIIGANSTVTKDIPPNSVAVGNPAKVVYTLEKYLSKERKIKDKSPFFDESYTLRRDVPMEKRMEMKELLKGKKRYID